MQREDTFLSIPPEKSRKTTQERRQTGLTGAVSAEKSTVFPPPTDRRPTADRPLSWPTEPCERTFYRPVLHEERTKLGVLGGYEEL